MDDASLGLETVRGRLGAALAGLGAVGAMALVAGWTLERDSWTLAGLVALASAGPLLVWRLALRFRRLRHASRLFAGALAGESVGQLVVDPKGRVLFINAAFDRLSERRTGEAPLDALARRLTGDGESLAQLRRVVDEAGEGRAAIGELLAAGPGRISESLRIHAQPVVGFPGTVHWRLEDITARRERDRVMLHEQAKLVEFMDHAPVGFFSVDRDGVFLFVNTTLAEWLGFDPHVLMDGAHHLHQALVEPPPGSPPYDPFPPFDPAKPGDGERRGEVAMRGPGVAGSGAAGVARGGGANGQWFLASVVQTVVVGDDGQPAYTRSVVRDLTPEKAWQEALRASEQRFQRFFEDAPIGIALVDGQGGLAECNDAFLRLIGQPAAAVLGRAMGELIDPSERARVAARLAEVGAGGGDAAPLEVRLAGGAQSPVQLYARPLGGGERGGGERGGGDGGGGAILHFIDMSERRNLEAQFAQSQKMQAVGQLAGGVAHDFNNLLTAMIGFCDLLLLRHRPGDQSFSDIMQIKQNANRAANLVRQLLAFSRQQTLQPRVIDVTDVLAELSNLLRRLIGETIELKMIHGRDLGLIKVDQNQLEQVIINLVVNARDAMGGAGRLTVVTSNLTLAVSERREHEVIAAGDYVQVEVIDTGVGIPKENLQRIFEPFFSTKEVGSGTGLGLSTVYGIVRQTGGFITVDSAPGEGARFSILLPRHKGEARGVEPGEPRERRGSDLTGSGVVLLVEDEDAVRVFSARALRNKGYQVMEAKNGEAALVQLVNPDTVVDLVITDVVMPQMDGPTLARRVRETRPDMKVIFISGYAEDRFKDELEGATATYFLPKPFSLKQLASKVKEVMRGPG